jgi:hypothetical protein
MTDLKELLFSEDFKRRSRHSENHFVRQRKLPFHVMFCFIMNSLKMSLQDEGDRFFKSLLCLDVPSRVVSAAALCKARYKLKHESFIEMNRALLASNEKHGKRLHFKGINVYAIDGSTLRLPSTPAIREEFGTVYTNGSDHPRSLARISQMHDVLNGLSLDLQIGTYETSEHTLALRHLENMASLDGCLILMDRGYNSCPVWRLIIDKGGDICVRMKKSSAIVRTLNKSGRTEMVLDYKPTKHSKKKCKQANLDASPFRVRIISCPRANSEPIYLMTTLIDHQQATADEVELLYRMRWQIEEGSVPHPTMHSPIPKNPKAFSR